MTGQRILGIEGGGTKTAWALVTGDTIIESGKLAPSNLRLTPSDQITKIFRVLPGEVDRVGVFLAGCATEEDRAVLLKLASAVWPKAKIVAGSDRESGMAACLCDRDGIAVNAGTGSSVTGRSGHRIEKAGGSVKTTFVKTVHMDRKGKPGKRVQRRQKAAEKRAAG